jgi:hypothetical protein
VQPCAQISREVARLTVVAGDDERRTTAPLRARAVEERAHQVGAQGGRDERAATVAGEHGDVRVGRRMGKEGAKRQAA